MDPQKKTRQAKGKYLWPVTVLDDTRYRASLIAALFHLKIGEVIDRAVVCYANALRIADKMEQEFPKTGLETPERDTKGPRRPPNLSRFKQHGKWFAPPTDLMRDDTKKEEEPS